MAKTFPDLIATVREGTGKGAARQARRAGLVPGIVYGDNADPMPINLNYNDLLKRLRAGRFMSTLFNLKVEGEKDVRVVCRAVQRDVVKDLPTHVDFLRLRQNSRIEVFITVEFENEREAPGIRKGGVLTVVRPEVELNVKASDIPDHITVDLTGLEIGDVITISDVTLPEGTRPTIDRDFVIANISAPSVLAAGDDEVEADTDGAATEAEDDGEEAEGEDD